MSLMLSLSALLTYSRHSWIRFVSNLMKCKRAPSLTSYLLKNKKIMISASEKNYGSWYLTHPASSVGDSEAASSP